MKIVKLSELNQKIFDSAENEGKLNVQMESGIFPLLVKISTSRSNRLLVTYNGAIQRSKAPEGIVFQRSSWLEEFESSVIQFADPSLVLHKNAQIGWGQISRDHMAMFDYMKLLRRLREILNLPAAKNTLHFGSSAGGFQALVAASLDKGANAFVNNPQLDWTLYDRRHVEKVFINLFGSVEAGETFVNENAWRKSVLEFFDYSGHFPNSQIYINAASPTDFEVQLPAFLEKLAEADKFTSRDILQLNLYKDPVSGHNPMNKQRTIRLVNEALVAL